MNTKAALCQALLEERVLNIKNCFKLIGLTNCPREISRMIEQPFDVLVSRTQMEGKTRYGNRCTWVNYKLNKTQYNLPGIERMRQYVKENSGPAPDAPPPNKTQPELF